jgi:hypothetical protein
MNDRNVKPSAIAEEPHRIYSWEDVRVDYNPKSQSNKRGQYKYLALDVMAYSPVFLS